MDITPKRLVYIVSDHTGLTAQNMAKGLLAQFEGARFAIENRPFVDTPDKIEALVAELRALPLPKPLVFCTVANPTHLERLQQAPVVLCDLFTPFLPLLEAELGQASHQVGRLHSIRDQDSYQARMDAVEFALATDDGLNPQRYPLADVILVGVSRAGKTPSSLLLAMQHGLRTANYPLTDDDFEHAELPRPVAAFRERLFGLTIDPLRLHYIRTQRKPGSRYASLERCEYETRRAVKLYQAHGLPYFDTTTASVEEITASIMARLHRS